MVSIWDAPQNTNANTYVAATDTNQSKGDVPIVDPLKRVYGTEAGPLLSPAGRGVVNGVPYGETAQVRERALDDQYRFRPTWRGRLAAETRKALGR